MSETITPAADAAAPETSPVEREYRPTDVLSSDPEPETTENLSDGNSKPADEGEKPENDAKPPKPEKSEDEKRKETENRRYAQLTAQRYAEKARADAAEASANDLRERIRRLENPGQAQPRDIDREVEERLEKAIAARDAQSRVNSFHEAGSAAYPDWSQRCQDLMSMGADTAFADLLVELPDGAKIAGALADDPRELERIASLKTERARAIALGKYSAELTARPAALAAAVGTRAPAPIAAPVNGRVRGEPDPNGSFDDYRRWSEKQQWSRR